MGGTGEAKENGGRGGTIEIEERREDVSEASENWRGRGERNSNGENTGRIHGWKDH